MCEDKQKLLQALVDFEEEYWFPHTYDKESLELIFKERPYYLISLLLSQARELLDEWRVTSADVSDLEEELLLCKLKETLSQAPQV